jgi:hypothetical protein
MNTEIPYNSIWVSRDPPAHKILVGMCYRYYDVPKYFTLLINGDGRSKLLSESFIKEHYIQEKK